MLLMTGTLAVIAVCTTLMSCTSERGVPEEPLTLLAFSSTSPGEVLLEWHGGPRGYVRWQYRTSQHVGGEDPWQDVPLSGSYSRTHRVTGLEARWYEFSVRPRPAWNEEPDPPATALGAALSAGPDGIVRTEGHFLPLERGGTFRIDQTPYVFVVPMEGVFAGAYGEFETYYLIHEPTGAHITIDRRTGRDPEWWTEGTYRYRANQADSPAEREAYDLLGQIRESIRYVPFRPYVSYAPSAEAGQASAQWFVSQGEGRWEYRLGRTQRPPTTLASAEWSGWKSVPSRSRILEFQVAPGEDAPVRLLEMRLQGQAASSQSVVLRLEPPANAPDGLPRLIGDRLPQVGDFSHEGGHTYRVGEGYRLEIPTEMLLRAEAYRIPIEEFASRGSASPAPRFISRILLMDERSGSYVLLDGETNELIERMVRPHPGGSDSEAMLDELVSSTQYSPWEIDEPLLAFSGGGVGEVVFEWDLAPRRQVEHWQYRYREVLYDASGRLSRSFWTRWADVPGDASTTRHRITGLTPGGTHRFQVRSYTATGPGVVYEAYAWAPPEGPRGLPLGRGLLESGRTFGLEGSSVVFDVPDGALLSLTVGDLKSDIADEPERIAIIRDVSSGSYLWISPSRGEHRRWLPPHAGRDTEALFDRIVASLREDRPETRGQ
ncbi:MAG: fibronectin type III domain-containing protein [Chloroflexi bacterium]|nr:fibronectin type III domain-containing protein [Chloroflexota bacterium]